MYIKRVHTEIGKILRGANESRTFYTQQALLPPMSMSMPSPMPDVASANTGCSGSGDGDGDHYDNENAGNNGRMGGGSNIATYDTSDLNSTFNADPTPSPTNTTSSLGKSIGVSTYTSADTDTDTNPKKVQKLANKAKAKAKTVDPKKFVRVDHTQDKINSIFQPIELQGQGIYGGASASDKRDREGDREIGDMVMNTIQGADDIEVMGGTERVVADITGITNPDSLDGDGPVICGDCGDTGVVPYNLFPSLLSLSRNHPNADLDPRSCMCCGISTSTAKRARNVIPSTSSALPLKKQNEKFKKIKETTVTYDSVRGESMSSLSLWLT